MDDETMESLGFGEAVKLKKQGICPFCKKPVTQNPPETEEEKAEFQLSGACKTCYHTVHVPYKQFMDNMVAIHGDGFIDVIMEEIVRKRRGA